MTIVPPKWVRPTACPCRSDVTSECQFISVVSLWYGLEFIPGLKTTFFFCRESDCSGLHDTTTGKILVLCRH